jgi:hypothetical protein
LNDDDMSALRRPFGSGTEQIKLVPVSQVSTMCQKQLELQRRPNNEPKSRGQQFTAQWYEQHKLRRSEQEHR